MSLPASQQRVGHKSAVRTTLARVAAEAGVAVSTVSEILNNRRNSYASSKTRQRVREAARKLQYRPNAIARSLRTSSTDIIGFLILETQTRIGPSERDVYYYSIIRAVERELLEYGHNILLSSMHVRDFETLELPSILTQGYVDSLIVLGAQDTTYAQWLGENCSNLVLVDDFCEGIPSVTAAHAKGGEQAADCLWRLGHRRFALIGGDKPVVNHELRLDGFQRRIKQLADESQIPNAGFSPLPTYCGDVLADGGATAVRALLAQADRPTAIFCANDHLAIHAIKALQSAGLDVPGDISVVGFDDTDAAEYLTPALTTVRIDRMAMGQMAVQLLKRCMETDQDLADQRMEAPTMIVQRSSTRAILAEGDHE